MLRAAAERGQMLFADNRAAARIQTRFPVLEDMRAALPDRQDVPRPELEDLSFTKVYLLASLEMVPRQPSRLQTSSTFLNPNEPPWVFSLAVPHGDMCRMSRS